MSSTEREPERLARENDELRREVEALRLEVARARQGGHARELALRNAIAEIFLSVADEEMYPRVLALLLDATESPFGVFGYIDEQGALVVPTMTRTIWDKCQVPDKRIVFPRPSWGESSWPTAIRQKRMIHSNEPSTCTPAGHLSITRHMSSPIVHRGEVVGLLQLANKEADYTGDDLALLETICGAIGPVLHARLAQERLEAARGQAVEALRKSNEALSRSNHELEQFAYVASHDLQEPLRMVSSYTQLLARRYGDKLDQDAKDFIGFAVDGATRMQRLIQDLLAYSRVTTRGRPPFSFDAHEALGEAVQNLQAAIRQEGALVTNGELPRVLADPSQIAQLFQNLVGNGIKFRKPGEPPRVHVSAARSSAEPDFWTFRVADNGIGIEPRHFERLFVIFQRLHTRQEYPGTGIGLALCRRIVERHGGKMWLESVPGEGTTFLFTLPSALEEEGATQ